MLADQLDGDGPNVGGVFVHVALAGFGLLGPMLLVYLARQGELQRMVCVVVAGCSGAVSGAGLALGGWFQDTTANIHSGYSFAGVLQWLFLAVAGGIVGAVVGGLLGWWAPVRRRAVVVMVVLAVAAVPGWIVAAARPTIDCDDRPSFCSDRYGE